MKQKEKPCLMVVANLGPECTWIEMMKRIYSIDGIGPTIHTHHGPLIIIEESNEDGKNQKID